MLYSFHYSAVLVGKLLKDWSKTERDIWTQIKECESRISRNFEKPSRTFSRPNKSVVKNSDAKLGIWSQIENCLCSFSWIKVILLCNQPKQRIRRNLLYKAALRSDCNSRLMHCDWAENIEYQSWSLNQNGAFIFVGWAVNVSSTIHQFILWSRYLNIWNYKQETLLGISKFYWFQFLSFKTFPVKTLLVKLIPEKLCPKCQT